MTANESTPTEGHESAGQELEQIERLARAYGLGHDVPLAEVWRDSGTEEEFVERARELDFGQQAVDVDVPEGMVQTAHARANLHARMCDDLTDGDRVVVLLEERGGEERQKEIVEETGWSDAKVSELLDRMERDGRVRRRRIGRENHVVLAEDEPRRLGADHDRRVYEDLLSNIRFELDY